MRPIIALAIKDLKLLVRGQVLYLAVFMVALGIAAGHLLRDRDLELAEAVYLVDRGLDPAVRARLEADLAREGFVAVERGALDLATGKHQGWLEDEAALRAALARAEVGFGAVLARDEAGRTTARYLMPDVLPEGTAHLMARLWDDRLAAVSTGAEPAAPVPVERIGRSLAEEPPPLGRAFVPLFIFSEAFIVAMWFGAVLLFVERSDRTGHALAVSPARTRGMLVAKVLALAVVVTLEVVATTLGTWGLHPGGGPALAAALVLFLQGMGLAFACAGYVRSLTSFTLVGAALTFVFTLPSFSIIASGFPDLVFMPTYAPMRAMREAFFPSGRPELVWQGIAIGAAFGLAMVWAGAALFGRRMRLA